MNDTYGIDAVVVKPRWGLARDGIATARPWAVLYNRFAVGIVDKFLTTNTFPLHKAV